MQTYGRSEAFPSRGRVQAVRNYPRPQTQELSSASMVISRRFSTDISHGRNGLISDGTRPPFSAQLSRYHVSHVRTLSFAIVNVANREKSIAASRPLHNAPEP